jgi:hypothetical protein
MRLQWQRLGKQYSAKAIQERCGKSRAGEEKNILNITQPHATQHQTLQHLSTLRTVSEPVALSGQSQPEQSSLMQGAGKVLEILMQPEQSFEYVPGQLKGSKKKRRLGNRL